MTRRYKKIPFKPYQGANSKLKYFVAERKNNEVGYCYGNEYQMLDDSSYISSEQMKTNDCHTTGAACEFYAPLAEKIGNSVGKWNQNKIISNKRIHRALVELEKILSYNRMISNKNSG